MFPARLLLLFSVVTCAASCATTRVQGRIGCAVDERSHARSCISVGLARRESWIHACDGMSEEVESAAVEVVDRTGAVMWQFSSPLLAHALSLSLHDGKARLAAIVDMEEHQERVVVWGRDGKTLFSRDLGDAVAWAALSPDGETLLVRWEGMDQKVVEGDLVQTSRSGITHVELFPLNGPGHAEQTQPAHLSDVTAIWNPDSSGVHVGGPALAQRWLPLVAGTPAPAKVPACSAAPSPTQALMQLPRTSCGHFELSPYAPGAGYAETPWVDSPSDQAPMLPPCVAP